MNVPPYIPTPQDNQLQIDGSSGTPTTVAATGYGNSYDFDSAGPQLVNSDSTNVAGFGDTGATSGLPGAGYAPGGLGRALAVVGQVTAITGTGSYTAQLYDSPDNSTWTPIGPPVTFVSPAAGMFVLKGFSTQRYIAISWTLGATSPSVTYNAWINPNIGN